jgi:8-oxo-dGTP diphosphatase
MNCGCSLAVKNVSERAKKICLRREIKEELPKLKLGQIRLWKELNGTNRHSGRTMSDAIFIVRKVSGDLTIGDRSAQSRAESILVPKTR